MSQISAELIKEREINWQNYAKNLTPVDMDDSISLYLNPECSYSKKRYLYRKTEVPEIALIRKILQEGDCVIDAGSNIGYQTVVMSQEVGNRGKVISFEPSEITRKILQNNINFNECSNVELRSEGLGSICEKSKFMTMNNMTHQNFVKNNNTSADLLDEYTEKEITVITLDSLFFTPNAGQRVSFIKIDVEGHELEVLKGARRLIERDLPIVLFEHHPGNLQRAGVTSDQILKFSKLLDFKIFKILEGNPYKLTPFTSSDLEWQGNALLLSPKKQINL